ncbi:ComEA family DNA-binding protein [Rhodococcus chondri]|uniref:ComEA family DNA-binding protein n=1 Tax=Rhodococcus chondri TaxID=3065941 RepID=A0ABU7JT95_9NOCA|nr:ComEA family DNA-binding protein [Rhodococcus sp. CC-R104]MEE2033055.1 ComEA family DNA-binding protein [Rhodococcus sp. CC-R104]
MASSDDRELVRTRLDAITGIPGGVEEPPYGGRGTDVSSSRDPGLPDGTFDTGPPPRLVDRIAAARWDTGRRGTVALASVGIVAALVALVVVWRDRPVPEPIPPLPTVEIATDTTSTSAAPAPEPAELVVSVVGLVAAPGLVQLDAGARVADALEAAGGANPGADLVGLNLAQRVADGDQIVVGSAPPQSLPEGSGISGAEGAAVADPAGADSRLVNLNSADEATLDALPGVGPVTAASIVSWRRANGAFTDVEQLGEVDGIGPARLARLRELVTV